LAVYVFLGTTKSSLNNQFVKTDSCKRRTMSFGKTVTWQNVFLSEKYNVWDKWAFRYRFKVMVR